MSLRHTLLLTAAVLLAATPALAQEDAPVATSAPAPQTQPLPPVISAAPAPAAAPSADPIGDLIGNLPPDNSTDEEEDAPGTPPPPPADRLIPTPKAEPAGAPPYQPPPVPAQEPYRPPAAASPAPSQTLVRPPPAYAPPQAPLDRPARIEETGRSNAPPLNPSELGYDARLKAGNAAAQGAQGPMDGTWTLTGSNGQALYSFLLVDKGLGMPRLEGAWRSLRTDRGVGHTGVFDSVERSGAGLTLRFRTKGDGPITVTLTQGLGGDWTGDIRGAGQPTSVTLRRPNGG